MSLSGLRAGLPVWFGLDFAGLHAGASVGCLACCFSLACPAWLDGLLTGQLGCSTRKAAKPQGYTRPTASKAQGARPHISKVPTLRHGGASKRDPKGSRPLRHKVTKAIGSKPSASKSKAQRFKLHFYSFLWNVSSRAAPFACKSLAILRGVCHHAFLRGVWFCPEFVCVCVLLAFPCQLQTSYNRVRSGHACKWHRF